MEMLNMFTQIIQTALTLLLVIMVVIAVILPLWALNKVEKRKKERGNKVQDTGFETQKESNPITEGERTALIGTAKLIKIIFGVIIVILLIYPIILLWSIYGS
jgi:hypothetical protein